MIRVEGTSPKNKKVPATVPMSPVLVSLLKDLHGQPPCSIVQRETCCSDIYAAIMSTLGRC